MANSIAPRLRHLNAAQSVDVGVLYSTISAGMLLARRYLTGRGIDQAFADRYGSAFGRTAAKTYRTVHGDEPRKAWSLVSGKWRRVNGYLPADTAILDDAYTSYPRTADYVAPDGPVIDDACRIPACDGTWHEYGDCAAQLGEARFDGQDVCLSAELAAEGDNSPAVVAFVFNMTGSETRRQMRDRASAAAFTAELRALADAIDGASASLPA